MLLLTGQRREKVCRMRWADIVDGVWTVPHTAGEKGVGGRLRLPPQVLAIINNQARVSDFVFPQRDLTHAKAKFERRCGFSFRLHDLRRTARTLLSRIGVSFEVAEAILGHRPRGIVAVYNLHSYEAEKRIALAKLADAIDRIVNPPPSNVVPLHEAAVS